MAILINQSTHFLIQGITGKEGFRVAEWMLDNGASVLAGVTPGKGGQEVLGVPVYNSVAEALRHHPSINASSIYVPPKLVLGAAREAIASRIPLIHCIAEGVPSIDTAIIIELARTNGIQFVGPSSIGIISPGKSFVGSIGGGKLDGQFLPAEIDLDEPRVPAPSATQESSATPAPSATPLSFATPMPLVSSSMPLAPPTTSPNPQNRVALLTKSGGMANTIANLLTSNQISQSTVVGLGGDRLLGTTFADLIPLLAEDDETKIVVLIGEIGGTYEEEFAEKLTASGFSKKVIAFISGIFAETLPTGVAFGHAGAIVSKTTGTRQGKIKALQKAGAIVVDSPEQIIAEIKKYLKVGGGENGFRFKV